MPTKPVLCAALGTVGGAVASALGGWDAALHVLVFFMATDYLSGLIVAGVFKKSDKSENGALESRAGFKGLLRKGMTLAVVGLAAQLDILIGTNFVRNATVIAFVVNKTLSVTENAALMGVPIPPVLKNSLEVLTRKAEQTEPKLQD